MSKMFTEENMAAFVQQMRDNERSKATIQKYAKEIERFITYLEMRQPEKSDVLAYRDELLKENSPGTVNGKLIAINAFLRFCGLEQSRVRLLRVQKSHFIEESRMLHEDEYRRLILTAKKKGNERISLLMQTIASTGIRISELRYITLEAVQKRQALIAMKGKHRSAVLTEELCRRLYAYAKKRQIESGCIFVSRSGKPLDRSNIWREMKKLCEAAHVSAKKVYPHSLRHLFARMFYAVKNDLGYLADLLGHSSVNTTRIYTAQSVQMHRSVLEGLRLVI